MTTKETLKLINRFKANNHPDKEIVDCLETVADVADGEDIPLVPPEN